LLVLVSGLGCVFLVTETDISDERISESGILNLMAIGATQEEARRRLGSPHAEPEPNVLTYQWKTSRWTFFLFAAPAPGAFGGGGSPDEANQATVRHHYLALIFNESGRLDQFACWAYPFSYSMETWRDLLRPTTAASSCW
jgi:hypothetical protein